MALLQNRSTVYYELAPLITGLGFTLLDVSSYKKEQMWYFDIIIYHKNSIQSDDCALVHSVLYDRLSVQYNTRNIHCNVSSPGVERVLKYEDELQLFIGNEVNIFTDSAQFQGCIITVNNEKKSIDIQTKQELYEIFYKDINKIQLYFSWRKI